MLQLQFRLAGRRGLPAAELAAQPESTDDAPSNCFAALISEEASAASSSTQHSQPWMDRQSRLT
eukprot:8819508-Pyramimonas_sp.AAC.1